MTNNTPLLGRFYGISAPHLNDFENLRTNMMLRTYGTNPKQAWLAFLDLYGESRQHWYRKGYRAKTFVLFCEQEIYDEAIRNCIPE